MWERWGEGGSLSINEVSKCHQGRVTVLRQENLGQVPSERQRCRAGQLYAEQDDQVRAPWCEAGSEMLWSVSHCLQAQDPSFPQEEDAPLEPDGPDPPAYSKAPTISRIKLGKISLCYPSKTLDVTHALHLLPLPLSWSPHGNVIYNPFPPNTWGLMIPVWGSQEVTACRHLEMLLAPGEMPAA